MKLAWNPKYLIPGVADGTVVLAMPFYVIYVNLGDFGGASFMG